ncbi:MAG TPA: HAD-IB family hydrolase [Ilumatobacteraceae bacterium]|nr:HAD-IB family hydrolase [Ilumatobacteraceae bacterium]
MQRHVAAVFDLDRTLITSSSATVFRSHLAAHGLGNNRELPLVDVLTRFYEQFGETWLMMQPARLSSRAAAGWSVETVETAMQEAAAELETMLTPGAARAIERHRADGHRLVMATTSPLVFVKPFADRLGFDDVVATQWQRTSDGEAFTGRMEGDFVWGRSKSEAVIRWAQRHGVALSASWAYSDSYFDAPLLAAVGHPVVVNPDAQLRLTATLRGWPVTHFDRPDGVAKVGGRELQEWSRPFVRAEILAPNARIEFSGIENIPARGPAIVVFNHRSYFDPTVMALVIAKAGRNVRGLGKKEVFDVPLVGRILKASGGIRVERGTGSDEPLEAAIDAVEAGELLMIAPQGTIPRGPAFFDPVLKGRWGAARIAAATGAPVIPVGLWGTEQVWPRSSRLPRFSLTERPLVTATVGPPVPLKYRSADADTKRIMKAISAVLPPEARERRTPTPEELARTYPPGYHGDPDAELERRPGTDT